MAADSTTAEKQACACQNMKIETSKGEYQGTGCTSGTKKKFAPGHDAKLRSLLVKAGIGGLWVYVKEADGSVSKMAHDAAAALHGLADHVKSGVEKALAREEAKKKSAETN